jgi:hypothetical protein
VLIFLTKLIGKNNLIFFINQTFEFLIRSGLRYRHNKILSNSTVAYQKLPEKQGLEKLGRFVVIFYENFGDFSL